MIVRRSIGDTQTPQFGVCSGAFEVGTAQPAGCWPACGPFQKQVPDDVAVIAGTQHCEPISFSELVWGLLLLPFNLLACAHRKQFDPQHYGLSICANSSW